jgi:hypothetical protein
LCLDRFRDLPFGVFPSYGRCNGHVNSPCGVCRDERNERDGSALLKTTVADESASGGEKP